MLDSKILSDLRQMIPYRGYQKIADATNEKIRLVYSVMHGNAKGDHIIKAAIKLAGEESERKKGLAADIAELKSKHKGV
jgi:hypothetical protein